MATITIQKGQTLSGIAKEHGTTIDALLKANPTIKNPNLIYAGSNLTLPTLPTVAPGASVPTPSAPVTPSTPVSTRVDQISSSGTSGVPEKTSMYGTSVPSNTSLLQKYRSELGLDSALKTMQDNQTSYLDTLKNLPKKSDIYATERTNRGIDEMQTNLQNLDDRLATMEIAIDDSEGDIRKRMSQGGGLVTESQTQRLVASEKQPLIDEYRKLLNERNRLADKIGVADTAAKDVAGLKYEDSTQPLTVAEKTLGFQQDQYKVLGDILSQVFGASEKDVSNLIDAAKNAKSSGSESGDVEAYALELLNNPNFSISSVPQNMRAEVLQKSDEIVSEANSQQEAEAKAAEAQRSSQVPITAENFGAGLKDVLTKQIPGLAKSGYSSTKNFLKGLFGIGN